MSSSNPKQEQECIEPADGEAASGEKAPKVKGKVFIRIDLCKGCGFCVNFCPRHTIVMSSRMNPKGYHYPQIDKDNCTGCDLCGMLCPDFAIYGIKLKNHES